MTRWTRALACLLAIMFAAPALAEKRVALVIGNAAYRHAPALANPKNDAEGVAASLQRLQFEVLLGVDLDKRGLEALLQRFSEKLDKADVALVFYAGHGLQVNGRAPARSAASAIAEMQRKATAREKAGALCAPVPWPQHESAARFFEYLERPVGTWHMYVHGNRQHDQSPTSLGIGCELFQIRFIGTHEGRRCVRSMRWCCTGYNGQCNTDPAHTWCKKGTAAGPAAASTRPASARSGGRPCRG